MFSRTFQPPTGIPSRPSIWSLVFSSAFRFQAVEDIVNLTEKSSPVAKGQANWGKIDLRNCEMFQMFPNLGETIKGDTNTNRTPDFLVEIFVN